MTEIADRFAGLQKRLPGIWSAIVSEPACAHTSIILPSFSVDQDELNKVVGAVHYEERLLFALIRLRNPNARLIYISSQPIHPDIVDYYLDLLEGVTARHARARLHMVSVYDASVRPLTEKVLERSRLVERLQGLVGDAARAYLTCYNSTHLERRLAVALDVPLNGVDPDLLFWGTKTSNRRIFAEAGVRHPAGGEGLTSEEELVEALAGLARDRPGPARAVVKLNQGFGGEGNGIFTYPASREDPAAIREALESVQWTCPAETTGSFLRKLRGMGGVAEELINGDDGRSPSVQMRISPDGRPHHVSSHEQLLGGATGQTYLGCRFPAEDAYRSLLMREAAKIGDVLSSKGVIGRFAPQRPSASSATRRPCWTKRLAATHTASGCHCSIATIRWSSLLTFRPWRRRGGRRRSGRPVPSNSASTSAVPWVRTASAGSVDLKQHYPALIAV